MTLKDPDGFTAATDKAAETSASPDTDLAYRRELGTELAQLEEVLASWRRGEINEFDVSQRIHEFHDGASRDLFVFYTRAKPEPAVAHAIANGVIRQMKYLQT